MAGDEHHYLWDGVAVHAELAECGQVTDAGPCRPNKGTGYLKTGVTHARRGYLLVPVNADLSQNLPEITDSPVGHHRNTGTLCMAARPSDGLYSLPACGQIGNAGVRSRCAVRTRSLTTWRSPRTLRITERIKAQFRFDAYNVFNHPVLGFNSAQGNTCVDCGGSSGQITDIEADASPGNPVGMRQFQFGVRITF